MTFRHTLRHLSRLGILGIVGGLLVAGCVIQDPPAITDLQKARAAIEDARAKGAATRAPDKFAELERRHLQARGVFYACLDAQASQMAQSIITDAQALLAMRETVAQPPPVAGNRCPVARLTVPAETEVDAQTPIDASGSSDPDNDALTYTFDFGDGSTAKFTFPRTTHRYARPGNYTVRVTVDDGRGCTQVATASTTTVRRMVLRDTAKKVLFDFNQATLKPEARGQLGAVVQDLKDQPTLTVELIGHADAVGSDQYNLGLSRRRAEAVRNYLVSQGVPAANIKVDWKGEREPAVPNTTAENRAQNRRVEITVRPGRPGA
jgi:outer membrane protein OmpA-like peptidoglycan-associated protein